MRQEVRKSERRKVRMKFRDRYMKKNQRLRIDELETID